MGYNIAFNKKQAQENLEFAGLMICELINFGDDSEFVIRPYYDGFLNKESGFDIYPYNSEISKKRFGSFDFVRQAIL